MGAHDSATIVSDNCCQCNYAALRQMLETGEVEVIYATYHVDVGETPFFVAVDFTRRKIVISIRGTLSMKVGTCIQFLFNSFISYFRFLFLYMT
jgi:sn1-specific diacylglycerol lipase